MQDYITCIVFGAVCLYFGIRALKQYFNETKNYTATTGTIIRYDKEISHKHNHADYVGYTPIFEYKYNGQMYQQEHRVTSSKYSKGMEIVPASKYSVGDTVKVRVYDDGKKVYAVIDDKNNISMPLKAGTAFTISGAVLLALGLYFKFK